MADDGAVEDDPLLQTLTDEIGKVDGGVDADGGEGCGRVDIGTKLVRWEDSEIWNNIFKPGAGR